jgi:hypothetical protein
MLWYRVIRQSFFNGWPSALSHSWQVLRALVHHVLLIPPHPTIGSRSCGRDKSCKDAATAGQA